MQKVLLTKEEVQAAIKLLDLAVKAGGLNVADAALVLASKFQNSEEVIENNDSDKPKP